jgi:lipoyl-dependent peroxiredoxin
MQIKRNASANWQGSGKDGKGKINTQSGVLSETQYGFSSRFENGIGTNPEELVGAALAGCFSMKLAFNLQSANLTAQNIETKATVIFENGVIPEINMECIVACEGLSTEKFEELILDAKTNCPISKLLNAKINLIHSLI